MPFVTTRTTSPAIGLVVAAVGLAFLALPADAAPRKKQKRAYVAPSSAWSAPAKPAAQSNVVYWGCCTVMGADPDPFIRSQTLRDSNLFFGGGGSI